MNDIFSPAYLAGLDLSNRIICSATNTYCGNSDGSVSDKQIGIYETLADSQPGLIVTANFSIEHDGKVDETQNSLGEDYSPETVKMLTDRVHDKGVPVVAQLSHAGRKSKVNENAEFKYGNTETVPLSEIKRLTCFFRDASVRAMECGFDGVQIHCGHGYLLSSFIDPDSNCRTDAYGGSPAGRFAFAREVLESVKTSCGMDYPLLIKINSNIGSDTESREYIEDLRYIAGVCGSIGVAAIELSGCDFTSFSRQQHNYYQPQLKSLRRSTGIALILTGGIRSLEDVQQAENAGADFIGLSRPLICEPDFLEKLREPGGHDRRSRCISCNQCFTLYEQEQKHCVFHKN